MHLLWFRRDLRLTDNSIVTLGSAKSAAVIPFFILLQFLTRVLDNFLPLTPLDHVKKLLISWTLANDRFN